MLSGHYSIKSSYYVMKFSDIFFSLNSFCSAEIMLIYIDVFINTLFPWIIIFVLICNKLHWKSNLWSKTKVYHFNHHWITLKPGYHFEIDWQVF